MNKNSIISGLIWKVLERFGVQGVQFVLQVVLARILDPEHYGVLSLMIVFTTLANVFIQTGFNTALIQAQDIAEDDYSSIFWVSSGIAVLLYVMLFLAAPIIGDFYNMPDIVIPFRVLALMLLPGAMQSVQLAKVSREMNFRKVFFSNVGGIVISGIVGIILAYLGAGIWALVVQTMLNVVVSTIVMCFTVNWHPHFVCDYRRVLVLFSFGWKLLVSGLIDTLYQDLRSLVIGKKYDSGTLGYYNRGKQFPQFIINAVNGAVQSVMLPAMSIEQNDKMRVKMLARNSIMISSYIIFPMMAGLEGVSSPLVSLLLTEKWLTCVPY
ncbi:MAG: lipopolysaccharide biosynthesis protein, partial [Firmicutes bacterium]|nr:lipopolysaccharide biosynthesis protein [Bacillota bacterium]